MRAGPLLAASLALLLLAPTVLADPQLAVTPERPLGAAVPLSPGAVVRLNFTVENQGSDALVVFVQAQGPAGWNVTAVPGSFGLPPQSLGQVRAFTLTVAAPEAADPAQYGVHVLVSAANSSAAATQVDVPLVFAITHNALVLDRWANPLPAPLDNAWGVFLLDLAFWSIIAFVLVALNHPLLAWLTRKSTTSAAAQIAMVLRVPLFLAVVFFGVTQAWDALPPAWWVSFGHRFLAAFTILVVAYVLYKLVRASLIYYSEVIAPKTETQLDDILVPVLEKVGGVVIVAGGALYFVGTLGIDLTAFVAGGVVVSMVLAFAAQDTLSNFFAGLALMLDRPFARGDDILLAGGGSLSGDVFRVDQIGLRSTRLYHYKNHQLVVVPNNDLAKNPLVNLMKPDVRYRAVLQVGVAFDSDVAKVKELMVRAATEHALVDSNEGFKPVIYMDSFADSALSYTMKFFVRVTRDTDRSRVPGEVRERILADFKAAGIEIPFPQRVVHLKGEAASEGAGAGSAGAVETSRSRGQGAGEPAKRS